MFVSFRWMFGGTSTMYADIVELSDLNRSVSNVETSA
jgi:hypothetical protein